MQDKDYPPTLPIPEEFWEDENWTYDNYDDLVRLYPDQWRWLIRKWSQQVRTLRR